MAFHDDVLALARHALLGHTMYEIDPELRAAARRLTTGAHAIIPEPARIEWAEAITYGDGEVRYRECDDVTEARSETTYTNQRYAKGTAAGEADVAHAVAVFREVRVLVDGTQIIGPWMAPADQFTRNPKEQ
ncbi:hypothetical protein ABZY58_11325 [Micromonospora tulbaghiae]|uniref:hypothetical protein n=1 Tax=Micromonospora tulbaghiae TaxID=479978 RepID=UPI0033A364B1